MENHKIKLNNYNLYLTLIYFLWFISMITYPLVDEYIKAGQLIDGVYYGTDSYRYLNHVNAIFNGEYSALRWKSKFGYLIFLMPFIYFDIPLVSVVIIQLFLTAFSAWCLYKITAKFYCKISGVICVALFLLYFPLQMRNFYLLTEILFIDITIIAIYLIVFFKRIYLPIIFLLIIALISIRPNGIMFLFSVLTCGLIFLIKYKKYLYVSTVLGILVILIFPTINLFNSYMVDLDLIDSISDKGIIWGWSFERNEHCLKSCVGVELINNNYQDNILDIFKFILVNWVEYFKLFLLKAFWLLFRARPYYSDAHNYYIIFFNVIFYIGFIYGYLKRPKNNFAVNVILFYILYAIGLVSLTFADWSGRFSLYFLPLIMIFSSYGILILSRKIIYKLISYRF
jgi:hypothetical protein